MQINEMVEESHRVAKEKGWHDGGLKSPLEVLMLMVTELAESAEEFRNDKPPVYFNDVDKMLVAPTLNGIIYNPENHKPEGWGVELADVIIRIGDFCGLRVVDLEAIIKLKMDFNATRSHRHGGKLY